MSMYFLFIEFLILDIFNLTYHIINLFANKGDLQAKFGSAGDTPVTGSI